MLTDLSSTKPSTVVAPGPVGNLASPGVDGRRAPGDWFTRRTARWRDWTIAELVAAKGATGQSVSLVVPARNEAATVGNVVSRVREALAETVALLDEIVVIDSDSVDDTGTVAADAGAVVHRARDIRPDLGSHPGKGEAMWKSTFVTTGDLLVFMDADLVDWDTNFVHGLLGPLLMDPVVSLVKGFYERPYRSGDSLAAYEAGRVTELVARPLISLLFPGLAGVVQPLAGEWAIRRSLFESLSVPTGYGVEIAALIDTAQAEGLDAIAQVDLGRRLHRHQPLLGLGAMATQVTVAAWSRSAGRPLPEEVALRQYIDAGRGSEPTDRHIDLAERPPAKSVAPGHVVTAADLTTETTPHAGGSNES